MNEKHYGAAFLRWTIGCNERECYIEDKTDDELEQCNTCDVYLRYKRECDKITKANEVQDEQAGS